MTTNTATFRVIHVTTASARHGVVSHEVPPTMECAWLATKNVARQCSASDGATASLQFGREDFHNPALSHQYVSLAPEGVLPRVWVRAKEHEAVAGADDALELLPLGV